MPFPPPSVSQSYFVSKGGSDATGDGTPDRPLASITAAMAAITDATGSKPYTIFVGPGVFNESPLFKPYVAVVGADWKTTIIKIPGGNLNFTSESLGFISISNVTLGEGGEIVTNRTAGDYFGFKLYFFGCLFKANFVSRVPIDSGFENILESCEIEEGRNLIAERGKTYLYACSGNCKIDIWGGTRSELHLFNHSAALVEGKGNPGWTENRLIRVLGSFVEEVRLEGDKIKFEYSVGSIPDGSPTVVSGSPIIAKLNTSF